MEASLGTVFGKKKQIDSYLCLTKQRILDFGDIRFVLYSRPRTDLKKQVLSANLVVSLYILYKLF